MMARIENLTNREYHEGPGVSKSDLDQIARSPAHYMAYKAAPHEPNPAMLLGSAFHTAVLEPGEFEARYCVAPEGIDRRTKAGKEAWAEFEYEANGKEILKPDVMETVRGMAEAVAAHPLARSLVTRGKAEQSIYWESSVVDGVLSKCRPDFVKDLTDGRYVVVDLKSTEDARPAAFERSAWNFRYYVQSAYYWDGCTSAFGHAPHAFLFIAVEKEAPYAVAVYEASIEMLNAGREEYFRNLCVYKECMDSGVWPAYPVEIQKLMPPRWAA
jgi:exodeoxyribonuclease VIII